MAGLRDGLLALGYHEGREFESSVRFTQGDPAALPAAARLVEKILQRTKPAEILVEVNNDFVVT